MSVEENPDRKKKKKKNFVPSDRCIKNIEEMFRFRQIVNQLQSFKAPSSNSKENADTKVCVPLFE